MNRKPWEELLFLYLTGALSSEDRANFERYLAESETYRAELDEWNQLADTVRAESDSRVDQLPQLTPEFYQRLQTGHQPSLNGSHSAQPKERTIMNIAQIQSSEPHKKTKSSRSITLAAALLAVIAFASALLFANGRRHDGDSFLSGVQLQRETFTPTPAATTTIVGTQEDPLYITLTAIILDATRFTAVNQIPMFTFTPAPTPILINPLHQSIYDIVKIATQLAEESQIPVITITPTPIPAATWPPSATPIPWNVDATMLPPTIVPPSQSEFELCVNDTMDTAKMARNISSGDVNGTLAAWNAVLLGVERCNEIRPEDQRLVSLAREGQTINDRLYEIERREMTPIEAFPNATLTRIMQRGEDLYVLDDNNDLVYRVTIRDDGLSVVPNSKQPIPSMRRGAVVGQFTVGDLFDITWAEDGSGLSQGNVLIALDKSGVIVEYSPTFLAHGVQKLLGTENWVNPVKAVMWQGRLYILDPAANQIWRYDPSGSAYPSAPLEYFNGQSRPNIINAVDFGIDSNGQVYVLFADAVLSVFRTGEVQPFGFSGFPDNQPFNSIDAMFLNSNPISPGIYMVSRINKTIYETTLAGTFVSSYRAFDEEQFANLINMVADESRQVVYALSGNSILAFPK